MSSISTKHRCSSARYRGGSPMRTSRVCCARCASSMCNGTIYRKATGISLFAVTVAPVLEPKKILIVLHGSVGDVTRALPLAQLVRRQFPATFLAWSVETPCLPLLEYCQTIDEVIVFDCRHWASSL